MISVPQQAPITIYPGPSAGIANLSKADLEIAQRLEHLRQSQNEELPTEEEMVSRLANLKGLPANHYATSSSAGAYNRPDTRTQGQQSDDLLVQVMEEASLEARLPNADDELEARLARLRGEGGGARPSMPPAGAVGLPPQASSASHTKMDTTLGEDLDDMSMDEVEALMKAASVEAEAGAERSMRELEADPEVAGAVAAAATRRKEKKKKKEGDMSGEERRSKSFESDFDVEGGKAIDAVTEQEEVQRIIDMYTKRAQLKKEKKRRKKEEAAAAAAAGGGAAAALQMEDSDSDIEISSESDLTSDSEKDSLSDELSE
ncbi:hypothetical protein Pcinc_038938 [Petrolisthes cinctipes]|uniref:Uncharacterized protein n=1 Tax=Petrolisthes cinctipes TaxID=88211 RepID=A0AAE1BPI4_PETCI|nr:hypothetical protein Pcinc_038938 [Petrolisthes cinctipes]